LSVNNLKKPLYLVTGANGFTGSAVVAHLVSQGFRVRAMVRTESAVTQVEELGATPVLANLTNFDSIHKAVHGTSGVFHIAAAFREAGAPDSLYKKINAEGTRNIFSACIASGVPRIVHCSTNGVTSSCKNPPIDESAPYSPSDIYQETKMEGEKIALQYFQSKKVTGVVLRPAMIYGPGDTRLLKLFKMVAERTFFYVGRGNAHVHFIDVRDLARAFLLGMERTDLNARVYLIAGQRAMTLRQAVEEIANHFGVPPPWLHLPVKPMQWLGSTCEAVCKPLGLTPPIFRRRVDFFTKERWFDTSRATLELGFEPTKSTQEEIHELCDWYQENGFIKTKSR
jgi:nucleoside-diphosphate-sugar epimerase